MSIKEAQTQYPIHELIRKRWSARSFLHKAIPQTDVNRLLEAASWSFSAQNIQPWYYVYAHQQSPKFEQLCQCLAPSNQVWAKNASLLLACFAQTHHADHANHWAKHDLGAANMALMIQATTMGLHGHIMAGFDAEKAQQISNLDPNVWEATTMIAIGYLDHADKLSEPFKTRELSARTRKPISDISQKL